MNFRLNPIDAALIQAAIEKLSGSEKVVLGRIALSTLYEDKDTYECRVLKSMGLVEIKERNGKRTLELSDAGHRVVEQLTITGAEYVAALLMEGIDESIQREIKEKARVRDEISAKGTNWAAGEIYALRKQLAAQKKGGET